MDDEHWLVISFESFFSFFGGGFSICLLEAGGMNAKFILLLLGSIFSPFFLPYAPVILLHTHSPLHVCIYLIVGIGWLHHLDFSSVLQK